MIAEVVSTFKLSRKCKKVLMKKKRMNKCGYLVNSTHVWDTVINRYLRLVSYVSSIQDV